VAPLATANISVNRLLLMLEFKFYDAFDGLWSQPIARDPAQSAKANL
jgi:hypothetical protein